MLTKVKTVTMYTTFCSLGGENKTKTGGFGHRTDMLQRQQNIAPEQQILQQSVEWTGIRIWMRQNSTTISQLKNVSVTRWPQYHRLKKHTAWLVSPDRINMNQYLVGYI